MLRDHRQLVHLSTMTQRVQETIDFTSQPSCLLLAEAASKRGVDYNV